MDFKGIPVRTIGPGSQPAEEDGESLVYIDMPKDMATYEPPQIAALESTVDLDGARESIRWLQQALRDYSTDSQARMANLTALDEDSRNLMNQVLGEGEVSVTCAGPVTARSQESVLAGVWRTFYVDAADRIVCDLLEVGSVPHIARPATGHTKQVDLRDARAANDVANAMPLLAELAASVEAYRNGGAAHAINLTLLPLSEDELQFLDGRLGRGPVDILSRAYGKCQVTSTSLPDLWWVRYYNSMSTLILNTLEVVDIPSVVQAAPEDLAASAGRLEQILTPYRTEVA